MANRSQIGSRLHSFQIDHEPGTDSLVNVVVTGDSIDVEAGKRLVLKGPFCQRSRMLPSAFEFVVATDATWRTEVVDPCYWTPQLPAYYRLQIVDERNRIVEQVDTIGLRRLQRRGADLWLDGRRWVLRAVEGVHPSHDEMIELRDQYLGLIVNRLDPEMAGTASREGIPIVFRVDAPDAAHLDLSIQIRQAARFAAVQMVVLPASWRGPRDDLERYSRNLLFAAEIDREDECERPGWSDIVMCVADEELLRKIGADRSDKPVLAYDCATPDDTRQTVRIRSACEQLQERLAPQFDLSGYVVRVVDDNVGADSLKQ